MITYNVTTKIYKAVEKDWLQWYKQVHIPEIMATQLFTDYKMYKLLDEEQDDEGSTYILQLFTSSLDNYNLYLEKFAAVLREKAFTKWGNQFIAFRTIMQVVH
jgi:hypothetical protein